MATSTIRIPGAQHWDVHLDSPTGDLVVNYGAAQSPDPADHNNRPAPTMVVGATVKDTDFAQLGPGGPLTGARVCRTFSTVGQGILPWTAGNRAVPAGVAEHHSFKDWPDDKTVTAQINHLLDTMPARLLEGTAILPQLRPYVAPWELADAADAGFSFLLSYLHEGENNGVIPREWRRRHRLAYDVIRQHNNGRRVGYMAIQTDTWTKGVSDATTHKGDGDVLEFWAGAGDFAAIDCYVLSEDKKPASAALYPDPAKFFELAVRLAYASGRPLWLPELGVIRQGNPAEQGAFRGQWITAALAYLRSVECAGVSWWNALGSNSRDFRLDPISLAAYKKEIAAQYA